MAINIIDTLKVARENKRRTKIMDTRKMHAWVHYYPNPGDHDDLHCHPGDQTFMCLDGECTMSFPDGAKTVMTVGVVALIEGGSFYSLENTGSGPMILMGTRTGPSSANQHINYETGKDVLATRAMRHANPPAVS